MGDYTSAALILQEQNFKISKFFILTQIYPSSFEFFAKRKFQTCNFLDFPLAFFQHRAILTTLLHGPPVPDTLISRKGCYPMIKLHDLPVLWTGGAVREATPAMAAAREIASRNCSSGDFCRGLGFLALPGAINDILMPPFRFHIKPF